MTKGFYQLTSGMLSQGRRLDVVSNNMTNLSTAGYKAETYTDRTFEEVLISRVGNKDKSGSTVIGSESYILAPDQLYVNYEQGSMKETGLSLDFAILGDGFFAIQTDNGVEYTRSGSFSLDNAGRLCLPGHGLVLGYIVNFVVNIAVSLCTAPPPEEVIKDCFPTKEEVATYM